MTAPTKLAVTIWVALAMVLGITALVASIPPAVWMLAFVAVLASFWLL